MTTITEDDIEVSATLPIADEAPYRVMIVEDDLAQATFAERILVGVGMQVQIVVQADRVLQALQENTPDLILMDLHLPGTSGILLTELIREHAEFMHLPIVFLTGDDDPDTQFEMLESGADDCLAKPIRPRLLIAAVQNRIKRSRAMTMTRTAANARHPDTGLYLRTYVIQHLGQQLPRQRRGGVLFVELEGTTALRERFGLSALERFMAQAGCLLGNFVAPHMATRLNDCAFLVWIPDFDATALLKFAKQLQQQLVEQALVVGGDRVRLRSAIGLTSLHHGFAEVGTALEAAESAVRDARRHVPAIAEYVPTIRYDAGRQRTIEVLLREALALGRFELDFQPIVAVAGGEQAQFQTLLRMHSASEDDRYTAADILPAAESAGLIADIDRWVIERALELIKQRQSQGYGLRLFVPQSPRTLSMEGYAQWLVQTLANSDVPGECLIIDIRLADAIVHTVALQQFCGHLLSAGVLFCLSQYQLDVESEPLLSQLPLGFVRLSARYAHPQLPTVHRDELYNIIDRAHRLGLEVIGHQIEDPQAAATLWMSGIDYIQGNLVQQAGSSLDYDFQHSVL